MFTKAVARNGPPEGGPHIVEGKRHGH